MKNWLGNTSLRIAYNNVETAVDGWNTYIFADQVFSRSYVGRHSLQFMFITIT